MALKASPESQALLLDLQALDAELAQLDHRAKSLPELATLAGFANDLDALRLTLGQQSGALEDTKIELGRVESDVSVVETRIARDAERLQAGTALQSIASSRGPGIESGDR